jgi:hypothetical protein
MQQTPPRHLKLSSDDAFFILLRAREFDDRIDLADLIPDEAAPGASPATADDDGIEAELAAAIKRLDDDALTDLVALIWIGRGDFATAEWRAARRAAGQLGRERAPDYVAAMPMVSDYLEQGLSAFGHTLAHYVETH